MTVTLAHPVYRNLKFKNHIRNIHNSVFAEMCEANCPPLLVYFCEKTKVKKAFKLNSKEVIYKQFGWNFGHFWLPSPHSGPFYYIKLYINVDFWWTPPPFIIRWLMDAPKFVSLRTFVWMEELTLKKMLHLSDWYFWNTYPKSAFNHHEKKAYIFPFFMKKLPFSPP